MDMGRTLKKSRQGPFLAQESYNFCARNAGRTIKKGSECNWGENPFPGRLQGNNIISSCFLPFSTVIWSRMENKGRSRQRRRLLQKTLAIITKIWRWTEDVIQGSSEKNLFLDHKLWMLQRLKHFSKRSIRRLFCWKSKVDFVIFS